MVIPTLWPSLCPPRSIGPVASRGSESKAPELVKAGVNLRDPGYSFKVDIWSAGVLFYLLMIGKWPFNGQIGQVLNATLSTTEKIRTDRLEMLGSLEKLAAQDLFRAVLEEELDFGPDTWGGNSQEALDFVVIVNGLKAQSSPFL